jgi:hypothetical protein
MTGKPSSSLFLWGDGQKKEYRQWTGPKRKQSRPVEKDNVLEDRGREPRLASQYIYIWPGEEDPIEQGQEEDTVE